MTRRAPSELEPVAGGATARLGGTRVEVPDAVAEALAADGVEVVRDPAVLAAMGRDWWPLSIGWAARGRVPALPAAVARPTRHRPGGVGPATLP